MPSSASKIFEPLEPARLPGRPDSPASGILNPCLPCRCSVEYMVLTSLCRRYLDHEKDVPAQQRQTPESSRLQGQNGHQGRPAGSQQAARQGAEEAEREWITGQTSSFPGGSGSQAVWTSGRSTRRAGGPTRGSSCFSRGPTCWAATGSVSRFRARSAARLSATASSACSGRYFADRPPASPAISISSSMPGRSAGRQHMQN
jgi:hypothetical protein